mmetsp:Transcript_453/g.1017  ORF Transcript_453/g.1017 Transcript_453/m.1017 type:complete len:114 (-) Transcript_453:211-552(-)
MGKWWQGRGKKAQVHPGLLDWAIAFLARTSTSVHKEVAKVMMLPDIHYVQRKIAELVFRNGEKALSMCIATMRLMREWAKKEGWSEHAMTVSIRLDSVMSTLAWSTTMPQTHL